MIAELDGQEQSLFASSPFLVFQIIAMADGAISKREEGDFYEDWAFRLQEIRLVENEFDQHIIHCLVEQHFQEWHGAKRATLQESWKKLDDFTLLLMTKLSPPERRSVVKLLLALAKDIAEAARPKRKE